MTASYVKLHICKALSNSSFLISDHSDTLHSSSFAELSPESFLDIGRYLGAFSFILATLVEHTLIINESKISNEYTSTMVGFGRMGNSINSEMTVQNH
jgi:hypothetical protein